MKKILHIYIGSLSGGLLTFQKNLNNELVKDHNLDVYLVYGTSEKTHKDYKSFFDSRIHLIEVPDFGRGCGFSISAYMYRIRMVRKYVCEINPDVIHLHSFRSALIGRVFLNHPNMFYTPHGFRGINKEISPFVRKLSLLVERILSLTRTKIIGSSQSEADACKAVSNKVLHVDNGIDVMELERYQVEMNFQNVRVYNIARAVVQKNPALFNEVAEKCPCHEFEWIGGGDLEPLLTSQNIHISGWGPREEALDMTTKCLVYLSTSLWEGLSLSLLEAMCMKKICIVANVPGLRDVIRNGENGFVFDKPDDVRKILDDIPQRPLYYKKIANQAYDDVLNFYSSKAMAKKYKAIYFSKEE